VNEKPIIETTALLAALTVIHNDLMTDMAFLKNVLLLNI
jgi:hypothetical protein